MVANPEDFLNGAHGQGLSNVQTSDRAIATKREAIVRTLAAYGKLYRFLGEARSREPFGKAK